MNAFLVSFLFTFNISTAPIKVAVIDTGSNSLHKLKLCKTGHVDFTKNPIKYYTNDDLLNEEQYNFKDHDSHGTNISHLIEAHAKNSNYCQIIIKYYNVDGETGSVINTLKAFRHAIKEKVNIINYSSVGYTSINSEKIIIKDILKNNIILVTSAGNDTKNLDLNCNAFPACYYKDTIVVGSGFNSKQKAKYSNYGKVVDVWINGDHQKANGTEMSGTSQSTAITTGKLVRMLHKMRTLLNE